LHSVRRKNKIRGICFALDNSVNSYNLFNAFSPGVYQIICKVNGKRYIGESNNVLDRVAKHTRNLSNRASECYELQKDWDLYGSSQFESNVICIGPEWETQEARLKKENELICSYSPEEIYNFHPSSNSLDQKKEDNYRIICEINGTRYNSIAEASRLTGESDNRIRVKLNNKVPGYVLIEKVKHGYEPIIANGREYSSIISAVNAGEAKDRFQVIQRLKNLKYKNWNYLSPEKRIDKTSDIKSRKKN
jgi:predicted GIY-YIG superfamily endonuclease